MTLLLTLTFCLALSTEAFLLPREVNLGKPVKVAVKIKSHENGPEKKSMPKNAQEELKFLMTLFEAFESHQKFVGLWDSLMKSKQKSEADVENSNATKVSEFRWKISFRK